MLLIAPVKNSMLFDVLQATKANKTNAMAVTTFTVSIQIEPHAVCISFPLLVISIQELKHECEDANSVPAAGFRRSIRREGRRWSDDREPDRHRAMVRR